MLNAIGTANIASKPVLASALVTSPKVRHALDAVRLLAPVPEPRQMRDFLVFEKHLRQARANRHLFGAGGQPSDRAVLGAGQHNPIAVLPKQPGRLDRHRQGELLLRHGLAGVGGAERSRIGSAVARIDNHEFPRLRFGGDRFADWCCPCSH